MVLDTACQRTCCGRTWAQRHFNYLSGIPLEPAKAQIHDKFQFGKGAPVEADCRAYVPVSFSDHPPLLIGTGVLGADVPLLASNVLLKALGMILDLPDMKVSHDMLVTPPTWLVRWRRLVTCLRNFRAHLYLTMVRAVRLGICEHQWLLEATPPRLDPNFQVRQDTCVQQKMGVGRRPRAMGAQTIRRIFTLIGAAIALFGQHPGEPSSGSPTVDFIAGGPSQDEYGATQAEHSDFINGIRADFRKRRNNEPEIDHWALLRGPMPNDHSEEISSEELDLDNVDG
ncbi:unnamed protein product [Symbiodinium necroappetens]|uniref:Uncharacterized protein n=1 Tax=Symbiodinium necroappetens TaxID=1628268 RepID=A0A813CG07_9DINO|nr:unnamed protein product [Symbiodinium necroappetens]